MLHTTGKFSTILTTLRSVSHLNEQMLSNIDKGDGSGMGARVQGKPVHVRAIQRNPFPATLNPDSWK